ncbi:MAG: NINE protein [Bifidobacterium sp.]|nr:NINE protein [Bifidobacterium sp.]
MTIPTDPTNPTNPQQPADPQATQPIEHVTVTEQYTETLPTADAPAQDPFADPTAPSTPSTPSYIPPAEPYAAAQPTAPADPYTGAPTGEQYAAGAPAQDPYAAKYNTAYQQSPQQPMYTDPYPQQPPAGYAPMPMYTSPEPPHYVPRNKLVAGALALFFGMFGLHNFYLGYTGNAIAQLLVCTLGCLVFFLGPLAALIWAWVEAIQILTSDYGTPAHRDARGVELVD